MELLAVIEVCFHFGSLLEELHTSLLIVEDIDEIFGVNSEHLWDLFSFPSTDLFPHVIDKQFQRKQL